MSLALDYVSPLPPVRSGIADYSLDLLEPLARLCDLRVIRLPGQPVSEAVEERWQPVGSERLGEDGRVPLYHMGNNRHHEGVAELAVRQPGILVLHDLVLHHLTLEVALLSGDVEPYLAAAAREHGRLGELVAGARRWGDLGQAALFELPFWGSLARAQRGVLVHSRWARDLLRDEIPDVAVRAVPMAVPLPPAIPEEAGARVRDELGLGARTPLVGSFGFQTPIKRTDRVIRALAEPALAEAHLLVGGEITPVLDLEQTAREAGVEDRVHFLGFLDFREFQEAIAACDLCVNLRYPTAGETSASLLRVLAVGKPTLVSDYAQFAELPSEVVGHVPLGADEVGELAARAGSLLADRERLRAMGRAAREWVRERHDPGRAAERLARACEELAAAEPGAGRSPATPFVPTSLTWTSLPGELTLAGETVEWTSGEARDLEMTVRPTGKAAWLPTRDEGGIQIQVAWRAAMDEDDLEHRWVALPRRLEPGKAVRLACSVRRPPRGRFLIVEPHVRGLGGVSSLGGPRRVVDVDTGREVEDAWTGTLRDLEEAALDA